ncbi:MAG: flavodoxin domain-containing protein [Kiritimatiellae bacterium]|nr:flavodoxin domain-containing protein [Kiritimatiellia bacterium]
MDKIHVVFGSTTGTTESVAAKIASALGAATFNIAADYPAAFDAELLVLGSSTWGIGDLQDDWASRLDQVKGSFAGKKVAVFGLGDSVGFADSFCVAADTIANAAKEAGATLVGDVLKLDDTNEAAQTDAKVAAWANAIKGACNDEKGAVA